MDEKTSITRVYYISLLNIIAEFSTTPEILSFFQKFGWLMQDKEANIYSAKFK